MAAAKSLHFPYDQKPYTYDGEALQKAWKRLHKGDCEPYPEAAPLQAGRWRRFADRARIAVPQTSSARVYAQPEPGARP